VRRGIDPQREGEAGAWNGRNERAWRNLPPQPACAELAVVEFREDSTARVCLLGELDMSTRAQVESALSRAEGSGATLVELDFGGLTFMDSSGVHVALDAVARARDKGYRLVLLEGTGTVQKVFALTGVDRLFGSGP
jgi:anti-sigma B factor antagonist